MARIALYQHDQGRRGPEREFPINISGLPEDQKKTTDVTHDSFDEVTRAANEDIGETSDPVERSKELIGGLR